jgi:hypothetical protein
MIRGQLETAVTPHPPRARSMRPLSRCAPTTGHTACAAWLLILLLTTGACAQSCTPGWHGLFPTSDLAAAANLNTVSKLASWDDGHGAALYAAGEITLNGHDVPVVQWTPEGWSPVGDLYSLQYGVSDLVGATGPQGNRLYAAGRFGLPGVGGVPIASFDGSAWQAMNAPALFCWSFAFLNAGPGPVLYGAFEDMQSPGGNVSGRLPLGRRRLDARRAAPVPNHGPRGVR